MPCVSRSPFLRNFLCSVARLSPLAAAALLISGVVFLAGAFIGSGQSTSGGSGLVFAFLPTQICQEFLPCSPSPATGGGSRWALQLVFVGVNLRRPACRFSRSRALPGRSGSALPQPFLSSRILLAVGTPPGVPFFRPPCSFSVFVRARGSSGLACGGGRSGRPLSGVFLPPLRQYHKSLALGGQPALFATLSVQHTYSTIQYRALWSRLSFTHEAGSCRLEAGTASGAQLFGFHLGSGS